MKPKVRGKLSAFSKLSRTLPKIFQKARLLSSAWFNGVARRAVADEMSAKLVVSVVAGVCGTIFLGYCIYFDRKRRSDPLFKQKLRQSKLVLTNAGCQSARGSQWNLKTLNFICVCAFVHFRKSGVKMTYFFFILAYSMIVTHDRKFRQLYFLCGSQFACVITGVV